MTTDRKDEPQELTSDELDCVSGGFIWFERGPWVSPLDIHGFNPQPDPPALPAVSVKF
jgi:hypothetical protein